MRSLGTLHLLALDALRTFRTLDLLTLGALRTFGTRLTASTAAAALGLLLLLTFLPATTVRLLGDRGGQCHPGNTGDQYHLAGHE